MRKTVLVKKDITVTDDIICNMCGETCFGEANFNGLIEVCVSGGYDSDALDDGVNYTFSICEHCLNKHVFDRFKIPPETEEVGVGLS